MRLGNFEIKVISDAEYRLDAGAMFGIVPKTLWEKKTDSDEKNRLILDLNCLFIKTPQGYILVDSGLGNNFNQKMKDIYEIKKENGIENFLKKENIQKEEIKWVILTHLHFDHCGGIVQDGKINFPSAKYVIQNLEWEEALNPHQRMQASYLKENFLPLKDTLNLYLVNGDKEILPGIKVKLTKGHSPGHQIILIESQGEKLVFLGDIIPTSFHLQPLWVCGYDFQPEESINQKQSLINQALEENWAIVMSHERKIKIGKLNLLNEKIQIIEVIDESD
ncbi:MAG: MBL fold metallo-hydrolase [Armatimonadetes bacterium]|nr:MBL fold metallo-hydrolase [Armatimonadota bacterium]